MRILLVLLMLVLTGTAHAEEWNGVVPAAVIADPPRDRDHPARSSQLLIPSGGVGLNALIYIAAGAGPHPTVVLLHGFPGNEQNLDLAQAIRRAGWNVLTLHYRGAWGSPGRFSIAHVIEDADAAIAFIRQPEVAVRYAIDRDRIVLGGHSMGGFASAAHGRHDSALLGLFMIDAWNVGLDGDRLAALDPAARHRMALRQFDDLGHSLQGADEDSTAAELVAHRHDWNYQDWAAQLGGTPLLIVAAASYFGDQNRLLAARVAEAGGQVSSFALDSDHSFQDHRIALAAILVTWLDGLRR